MSHWTKLCDSAVDQWCSRVAAAESRADRRSRIEDTKSLMQQVSEAWDKHGPGPSNPLRDKTISAFVNGARSRAMGYS